MTTFQSLTLQYPHRCRDGHPEIGHSTDGERCPVCLERDRAERAEADARGWADSFKQAEDALVILEDCMRIARERVEGE